MVRFSKLGLIAGGGDLPVLLAEHCAGAGTPYFVARIAPLADPALMSHPGAEFGLGEIDARFKALRAAGCDAVTFVGNVGRPDFKSLKLDLRATLLMPRVLAAAQRGDDALMSVLVRVFEDEGFTVIGPEAAMAALTAPTGALGRLAPSAEHLADIAKGMAVARALGAHDIGQGCVVCNGLVLAVEAQEGTDAMLARVAQLPSAIRGAPDSRLGVLVKCPKPQQERRIDLPAIGVRTLHGASAAGLAGIAVEAGGALIAERAALIELADTLGLFIYGDAG